MHTEENNTNKPPSLLSGILGNALKSMQRYKQEAPALETKKCPGCGAARPEGTDLRFCDFCGHQFY